jgi:flagellar protein FliO/FliZ
MNSLFGVELPTAVNFVIAFVVVLVLIGAAAWLVRRFGATRLDAAARGRQPRLAVIDTAAVDGRRKLVIIRRDNVEHLLMIGGPTDVVVETNIVRAAQAAREAAAPRNGGAETAPRALPLSDPTSWPLQPEPMPAPAHALRADRVARAAAEDPAHWQPPAELTGVPPPPLRAVRPADTLIGLADELSRPDPAASARAVHAQPAHAAAPQPAAAAASVPQSFATADQSLAEMAQRLEAALRRPSAQKVAAEAGTARVAAASEGKPAPRPEQRTASAAPPKGGAQPRPQTQPQPGNLEKEMASLLSRPGKT